MKKFATTIIACSSIRTELEELAPRDGSVKLRFLPLHLHRQPRKLRTVLQYTIDEVAGESREIVLGYGLCSNAAAELLAPETGLIIPKVHDCIAMYLGGNEAYQRAFRQYPGTYFLTKSWIDNRKDPLGLIRNEYKVRVGSAMAQEAMETEIRNYRHIAYINTIDKHAVQYRQHARENARFFNKQYIELKGNPALFHKMLSGPRNETDFVHLPPNTRSHQHQFLK